MPPTEQDLDAFDRLVHEHAPAAYRVALAVVGESQARDLVHEAFLAAWQQLPHLRDPERFAPWLQRIVVSRGRSLLHRGHAVREIPVTPLLDAGPRVVRAHEDLATAFAALAYDQRAVIALHAAARLPPHDLAESLDLSTGAAGSRLAGALEALCRRAGIGETPGPPADDGVPPQDPRVESFLGSLGEGRVPQELAASVTARVRAHPSRRPSARLPLLAGAAGLLVVVGLALFAGWRPPIDILPGPQESSPAPSTPSTPPGAAFEFARIAVTGAELRTDAGGGSILRSTTDGDLGLLVLVRERRAVGGRSWTKVELESGGGEAAFVWLPETVPSSGPTGYDVPVLEPTGWLPCSTRSERSVEMLLASTLAQRLACFGGGSFEIGPVQVFPGPTGGGTGGSPTWLAGQVPHNIVGIGADGERAIAPLRVDPALGLSIPGNRWVRLTVHLDDPAASGCTRTTQLVDLAVGDAADQELWCRQQLVVTGYTESGAPTPTPLPSGLGQLDAVVVTASWSGRARSDGDPLPDGREVVSASRG